MRFKLEIDLYQLLELLLLALVVGGMLELAIAVKIVMKALYGACATCEALQVRGKIRTFLVHARIISQPQYIILCTKTEPDANVTYHPNKNFALILYTHKPHDAFHASV